MSTDDEAGGSSWRDSPTISVSEAAEVLGIGRDAAYEAVRNREIPSLRFGRIIRVPTRKLATLLGEPNPATDRHVAEVLAEGADQALAAVEAFVAQLRKDATSNFPGAP